MKQPVYTVYRIWLKNEYVNPPGLMVEDFPNFIVGSPVAGIRTVAKSEPTSASSTTPLKWKKI